MEIDWEKRVLTGDFVLDLPGWDAADVETEPGRRASAEGSVRRDDGLVARGVGELDGVGVLDALAAARECA